jgi:hypothetical protein
VAIKADFADKISARLCQEIDESHARIEETFEELFAYLRQIPAEFWACPQ